MISFDVFDTALFREVYLPTDIFILIEKEVGNDFLKKRLEAEGKAVQRNKFYGLDAIYKFLPEFDKNVEIQMELNNCKANPEILKIYDPNNCVFISDMYLPSSVIAQMLERCGYKDPKVFVSWEWKACKGDGALFKKVQKLLDKKIEKHYGDNYEADIEGAKKAGIPEVEFNPALHNIKKPIPAVKDPRLRKYMAEVICSNEISASEKAAIMVVPLVVGFTKWVLNQRKEGQKIFFLSRDMITPYRVATELLNAKDVYYLKASRRSLSAAGLNSGDPRLIEKVRSVLSEEEIKKREKEGTTEVLKYLSRFDMKDGDIIADIGYSASIQAILESATGLKFNGLYMQICPSTLLDVQVLEYVKRRVIQYCLMIETILGSDEDCIENYKDGEVIYKSEEAERKVLATFMNSIIMREAKKFVNWELNLYDVEQALIHLQYYPNDEMLQIFNKSIFSNREIGESIINFSKEKIKKGLLKETFRHSYALRLFKRMLEADPELSHLSRLI